MEVSSLDAYGLPQASQRSHLNASVLLEPDTSGEAMGLEEQQPNSAIVQDAVSATPTERLQPLQNEAKAQLWKIFGSTFITIFLAELGDKTQVATLLMSAESHSPWSVFTGAAIALVTTSLLGVLVGHWLSSRVSPKTLDRFAGVTLALLALWLLLDVVRM